MRPGIIPKILLSWSDMFLSSSQVLVCWSYKCLTYWQLKIKRSHHNHIHLKLLSLFLITAVFGCVSNAYQENTDTDLREAHHQIKQLHEEYVKGWKDMNEERIMNLIEDNAMIQPNRLTPIQGKENIRAFWFPKDSSTTVINNFETKIISVEIGDTIAIMTHESHLEWDYAKDTIAFGMIQKGINTTVYRIQEDQNWKIWRSMWTDLFAQSK